MKHSIAILASGSGSNAEKIALYFKEKDIAKVNLIVTNNPEAYVIQRASNLGIPLVVFNSKEDYQGKAFLKVLSDYSIDLIVLAGFLWLIPPNVIEKYPSRIVNIHPALLPKYGGKGMYGDRVHKAVSTAGDSFTGITIHYVNHEYDEGKIIYQTQCEITPGEDPESIAEKVHQLEYEHYPRVIEKVLKDLK